MNFKSIWLWLFLAAGLFAFIFFFQRHGAVPASAPAKILPRLKPEAVTAIQLTLPNQLDLRVERTNDAWQLFELRPQTKPVAYAAQSANVDILLALLAELVPARQFSEAELTNRFNADRNYGFAEPQATLLLEQPGETFAPMVIGTNTPPGDQVFVKVVGRDDIYVVDANLLRFIPRSPNDWRDTTFVRFKPQDFDRLVVSSGNERLAFENDPATHLWQLTAPFKSRADNAKVNGFLQLLEHARIQQFVSDQPTPYLESYGLQPPEHEVVLARGTNVLTQIQFGKSPTNAPTRVYARRTGRDTVVTVPKDVLAPWSTSMQFSDYRDPYLLHLPTPLARVNVVSVDSFSLVRQTNDTWTVMPQNFPADAGVVNDFLAQLGQMRIVEFTRDIVTEGSLGQYGLASPMRKYILEGPPADAPAGATNSVLAEVAFGSDTNHADLVYARRADENSVYAVRLADFARLKPLASQFRDRRIWHFSINDVAGATFVQGGKTRQLKRNGPNSWSLARDSQGMIDDLAIEQTVSGLCDLSATSWGPICGEADRKQYGLAPPLLKITLELKNGEKPTVEIATTAGSTLNPAFAAVTLDGQLWVFEFPANLISDVLTYLAVH